jgi:hypothetical protein
MIDRPWPASKAGTWSFFTFGRGARLIYAAEPGRGFIETIGGATSKAEPLRVTRPGFRLATPFAEPTLPPVLGADTEQWLAELDLVA